jgi:hypothetical protein
MRWNVEKIPQSRDKRVIRIFALLPFYLSLQSKRAWLENLYFLQEYDGWYWTTREVWTREEYEELKEKLHVQYKLP